MNRENMQDFVSDYFADYDALIKWKEEMRLEKQKHDERIRLLKSDFIIELKLFNLIGE